MPRYFYSPLFAYKTENAVLILVAMKRARLSFVILIAFFLLSSIYWQQHGAFEEISTPSEFSELFFIKKPTKPYKEIGLVQVSSPWIYAAKTRPYELLKKLKRKAENKGADTIINVKMYTTYECKIHSSWIGQSSLDYRSLWAEGIAIKYRR